MDKSENGLPFETKLLYILRDTDLEESPVRSEGLDFIETTDLEQFVEAGWAELLLIGDYLFRVLLHTEQDDDFSAEWQDHAGMDGPGKLLLFQRTAEVSTVWLNRLERIRDHHSTSGTEPSRSSGLPVACFLPERPLHFLTDMSVSRKDKFSLLIGLTKTAIAHASIATTLWEIEAEDPPASTEERARWLSSVSVNLMTAGCFTPLSLLSLSPDRIGRIERIAKQTCSSYESELVAEFRSRTGLTEGERRVVVVDPQFALDLCGLETIFAMIRAFRSSSHDRWGALRDWIKEGRRILTEPSIRSVGAGRMELRDIESWHQPTFGSTRPSSIAESEDLARGFLTIMIARRRSTDIPEVKGSPGGFIEITTRREVIRLRLPRSNAQPWLAGPDKSTLQVAFNQQPLLTWLLFPSTGPRISGRFWRDGVYGRMFESLEHLQLSGEEPPQIHLDSLTRMSEGGATDQLADGTLAALLPGSSRACVLASIGMMSHLIRRWVEWGTSQEEADEASR